jgi:magnesium chelatase subunit I
MQATYPFSAVVGQDEVKQSLLITAVDPSVGGVLILGDRGTGKSTAIRALAALLPSMQSVNGCQYNATPDAAKHCTCAGCHALDGRVESIERAVPVIDLPLGATEDRVVGAFDIEYALSTGKKRFKPGLLADAHRGYLYVDEVNLLEDHIVDVLLDVAASGVNVVERDGISERHDARFVLIGSGNPEEGELRPQLLDRFGLSVEVSTPTDIEQRMMVVTRRDEFDRDPVGFVKQWQKEDKKIQRRIVRARKALSSVSLPGDIRESISQLCVRLGTDGLRGDLTLLRAARALAALQGEPTVATKHVIQVASMTLRHRLRRDPLDESGSSARVERVLSELFNADAA